MFDWRVREVGSAEALESELNALEREGYEVFQIEWRDPRGKAGAYVVARREVARRSTDVQELLSDQQTVSEPDFASAFLPPSSNRGG